MDFYITDDFTAATNQTRSKKINFWINRFLFTLYSEFLYSTRKWRKFTLSELQSLLWYCFDEFTERLFWKCIYRLQPKWYYWDIHTISTFLFYCSEKWYFIKGDLILINFWFLEFWISMYTSEIFEFDTYLQCSSIQTQMLRKTPFI